MAEDDLFVGEVNDDVRRDSALTFLNRFKYIIVGLVAAVVAFVAFMEWRGAQATQESEAQASAIERAIAGDAGAKDALMALDEQSSLTEMMLGKIEEDAGNKDAAIASYQKVADNSSYSNSERDLARLRLFALDEGYDGSALMNPNSSFEIEAKLIDAERRHVNADIDGAVEIITGLMQNERAQSILPILESTLLAWGVEVPDFVEEDTAPISEGTSDETQ